MPGNSVVTTVVFGWTVRQTFTDQYTNGTFAIPKSAIAADSFSEPGPPYCRSSRYATKISHRTSADVSRASHCHQTPQAFLPPQRPGDQTDQAEHDRQLGARNGDSIRCGPAR